MAISAPNSSMLSPPRLRTRQLHQSGVASRAAPQASGDTASTNLAAWDSLPRGWEYKSPASSHAGPFASLLRPTCMPLAFGVKIAWAALSLAGVIGCWAVLLPLGLRTRRLWAPVLYAAAITLLQVIFSFGLIWRMDPNQMPLPFCYTQVIGFGFATSLLTGLLATTTTATTVYVSKPKQWASTNDDAAAVLDWRNYYLLSLLLFPALSSTVHITLVVSFADFDIADGMVCVPHPLWLRFVGPFGPPLLLTLPSLFLTIRSIIRTFKTHAHIRRARRSVIFENLDRFTVRPTRTVRSKSKSLSLSSPKSKSSTIRGALPSSTSPGTTPASPQGIAVTMPTPSSSQRETLQMQMQMQGNGRQAVTLREEMYAYKSFHLPYHQPQLQPQEQPTLESSAHANAYVGWDQKSFDTVSSVSFAEFTPAPPPTASGTAKSAVSNIYSEVAAAVRGKGKAKRNGNGQGSRPGTGNSARSGGGGGSWPSRRTHSPIAHVASLFARGSEDEQDEDDMHTPLRAESMHNSDRVSVTQIAEKMQYKDDDMVTNSNAASSTPTPAGRPTPSPALEDGEDSEDVTPESSPKPSPTFRNLTRLPTLVRSLLAFQLLLASSQILACITPLADLISARGQRSPSQPHPAEFGTQHVALVLVAWAPLLCFGPLAFWRPRAG